MGCYFTTKSGGIWKNLRRRPPPHAPLRGSITRPTCVLSTLHDEGHLIAVQDSLPACWLGVSWAGLAPAGFHSRISRGSPATSFPIEPGLPGAQILGARPFTLCGIGTCDNCQKSKGYCWSTYIKVLGVLFLGKVFPAFLPSKKACWTHKFWHLGVGQQYPKVK
jgi:hypothetical protein